MFYDFAFTVPLNTLDNAPVTQQLKIGKGIIHRVALLFPPGPHGMVKVKLYQGGHQFLPTNPEGSFASDDEILVLDEHYELTSAPYILTAVGSSPGTTYPHTISIRIGLLAPELINPFMGLPGLMQKFLKLVGIR